MAKLHLNACVQLLHREQDLPQKIAFRTWHAFFQSDGSFCGVIPPAPQNVCLPLDRKLGVVEDISRRGK